jgi:hypothetical protein|tara:strand:- start:335 stop:601 length:267 start_codon:yes stop_codon:yes gene_type:complete
MCNSLNSHQDNRGLSDLDIRIQPQDFLSIVFANNQSSFYFFLLFLHSTLQSQVPMDMVCKEKHHSRGHKLHNMSDHNNHDRAQPQDLW